MPIYEYQASDGAESCHHCRQPFERLHKTSEPPLRTCPNCGAPVTKLISAPAVGASRSGFDDKAQGAGFHKLKRRGKGEYEKMY